MRRDAVLRWTPSSPATSPIASSVRRSSKNSRIATARSTAWQPETADSMGLTLHDHVQYVHPTCILCTLGREIWLRRGRRVLRLQPFELGGLDMAAVALAAGRGLPRRLLVHAHVAEEARAAGVEAAAGRRVARARQRAVELHPRL